MQEVKEFSQQHIGEQIIDAQVVNEDVILNMFSSDNDYLKSWEEEFKLAWIRHWKEEPTEEETAAFEKIRETFGFPKSDTMITS
jgi:hypothetical protein